MEASGVELAGAVQELARSTLRRDFRRIRTDQARVILLESGPALLEGFPEELARYAHARLRAMGVEVRLGDAVETLDGEGVVTAGERIRTANIFWCAGVAPTPMADWLGAQAGKRGAVRVGPDCSVPGRAEVFAIGDVAEFEGAEGKPLPGVAPVAQQQGKYVAKVIAARIAGRPAPPTFRYKDQGSLAIIGRASAVADLPFARLTGRPAWLLWSGVHLVLLNGLHNRVLVYIQWLWAWLSYGRGARLIEDLLPPELAPARQAPGAGLTQEKA